MSDHDKSEDPAQGTSSDAPREGKTDTGAALFELGTIKATPGALAQLADIGMRPMELVARHAAGDWGNLTTPDDAAGNHAAIAGGLRILSSYGLACGEVWVITEHDRSATVILLPSEA